jgi:hypothetical protein
LLSVVPFEPMVILVKRLLLVLGILLGGCDDRSVGTEDRDPAFPCSDGGVSEEDGGGAPKFDDGGADAGEDGDGGGHADASVDFEWSNEVLCTDAGVIVEPRDGGDECGCTGQASCDPTGACTLHCAACSELTPCEGGGICEFIRLPSCTGNCVFPVEVCGATGPSPEEVRIKLVQSWCPPKEGPVYQCEWRHTLVTDGGTLSLSVVVYRADGGVTTYDFRCTHKLLSNWDAAPDAGLWCASTQQFQSVACFFHPTLVQVEAVAPNAAVAFEYHLEGARRPPQVLHWAVVDTLRAAEPAFRDAGLYWRP